MEVIKKRKENALTVRKEALRGHDWTSFWRIICFLTYTKHIALKRSAGRGGGRWTQLLEFVLPQHLHTCQLELLLNPVVTLKKVENVIATEGNVNGNKEEMNKGRISRGWIKNCQESSECGKKTKSVRGAKGVGKEEVWVRQSRRRLMGNFAYEGRKWTKSKDRFPLKTPAGNDKGNLVSFIPSYIRYRMLKKKMWLIKIQSVRRFMCLSSLFVMCLKTTFQKNWVFMWFLRLLCRSCLKQRRVVLTIFPVQRLILLHWGK